MYKIIFDTNLLKNDGLETFLGHKKTLEQFKKHCEILIPDIVIDEIKKQKADHFDNKKYELEKNPLYKIFFRADETLSKIDIDEYIKILEKEENILYKIIYLSKQEGILEKIKELALKRLPPFKGKKDEGFKDAYIYFTILEYVETKKDKIFVATNDCKLKEALEKHHNIIVIENYEDFTFNIIDQYKDEYFIEKVREELGDQEISAENVIEFWKNTNENDILVVSTNTSKNILEIDSREIIGTAEYSEYEQYIEMLINSGSFAKTHHAIAKLKNYIQYFSRNDIENIFNASINNTQIRYIVGDEDVKEFLLNLYESNRNIPDEEIKSLIEELKNDTK